MLYKKHKCLSGLHVSKNVKCQLMINLALESLWWPKLTLMLQKFTKSSWKIDEQHWRSCGRQSEHLEKIVQQFMVEKVWFVAVRWLVHTSLSVGQFLTKIGMALCSTPPIHLIFFPATSFHSIKWKETWKESIFQMWMRWRKNNWGTVWHPRRLIRKMFYKRLEECISSNQ